MKQRERQTAPSAWTRLSLEAKSPSYHAVIGSTPTVSRHGWASTTHVLTADKASCLKMVPRMLQDPENLARLREITGLGVKAKAPEKTLSMSPRVPFTSALPIPMPDRQELLRLHGLA